MISLSELLQVIGAADREEAARAALGRHEVDPPPWFVRVAAGVGTWVGAGLIGMFLVMTDLARSEAACVVLGLAGLAGAALVSRAGAFVARTQVVLALSVGGQSLLLVPIVSNSNSARTIALALAALQVVMIVLAQDSTHRFLSALTLVPALWFAMGNALGPFAQEFAAAALFAVACAGFVKQGSLFAKAGGVATRPVIYGFAIGVLTVLVTLSAFSLPEIGPRSSNGYALEKPWALALLIAIVGGVVARVAVAELRVDPLSRGVIVAAVAGLAAASFAIEVPGLLAAWVLLVVAHLRRERVLAGFAASALAAFFGLFYYRLDMPLMTKSFALAGAGLVFLVMQFALRPEDARPEGSRAWLGAPRARALAGVVVVVLALVFGLAAHRESIRTGGTRVVLALRPVDPRSLIQGDYMVLEYAIEEEVRTLLDAAGRRDATIVLARDERDVATVARLDDGSALPERAARLQVKVRDWDVRMGAESFFFEEGSARAFEVAKFAELRVSAGGTALLTNLLDDQGRAIDPRAVPPAPAE